VLKKIFLFCLIFCPVLAFARDEKREYVTMCYNLENLFDPIDDSLTQDEEFTPTGRFFWTWKKLTKKCNDIAKTIVAAGDGNAPALVGLCEVENRWVLHRLTDQTPLAKIGYGIVHRNSPDPRGIDVALLYRTDVFTVLHAGWFQVEYEPGNNKTREILYAKGVLDALDTVHVFVNHWPSKRGGALQSEPRRMRAAEVLRRVVDSIFAGHPQANILVMGDFNDTPESQPVTLGLGAVSDTVCLTCLHNLMLPVARRGEGSLKYRRNWELIDLFFISGNMLDTLQPICCLPEEVRIFRPDFLLERDDKFLGEKVHRTYEAGKYKGGASDHLPVILPIKRNY
jgi:endonuclease/exonuclease/phosphatase family metal-dependent hydrolase